jgi:hypothetical protein
MNQGTKWVLLMKKRGKKSWASVPLSNYAETGVAG